VLQFSPATSDIATHLEVANAAQFLGDIVSLGLFQRRCFVIAAFDHHREAVVACEATSLGFADAAGGADFFVDEGLGCGHVSLFQQHVERRREASPDHQQIVRRAGVRYGLSRKRAVRGRRAPDRARWLRGVAVEAGERSERSVSLDTAPRDQRATEPSP
jgi:hypothetical protein